LVGAGPGDPGLLTVRGLALVRAADVIVHDRLIDGRLLDEARADAVFVDAGKRRGHHELTQAQINATLVWHARSGRRVVRLKGGDPFVFGRGGEEAQALAEAGIPFEIVPGVSSAIAAPAAAGIPVTHRRLASSFAVVTATESEDGQPVRWAALAGAVDTLVVLMGVSRLRHVVRALRAAGRPADTPVAVGARATTADQQAVTGTLATIATIVDAAGIDAPAVIVIGDVVRIGERLAALAGGADATVGGADATVGGADATVDGADAAVDGADAAVDGADAAVLTS
jgi:uroporphyrin-III C-methyltransferase